MTSVFIGAAIAMILYCLWVRRDTWQSRWEVGATFCIAMEGLALLLMSPWASFQLGPPLHSLVGLWNVQQLFGWLCLIIGVHGNIYHILVRLTEPAHVVPIMRRHLMLPVGLGISVMLVAFVKSPRGFEPDMFAALSGDGWLTVFEVTAGALLLFLSGYTMRLTVVMRQDPRGRMTFILYVAAMTLAVAACVVAGIAISVGVYAGTAIWACVCLSVMVFAYGLARSWRAKKAWFSSARK